MANSWARRPEQLVNIKRFQGLAQAIFPPNSFLSTPSSTHIRQRWFLKNLKNNMARLFQTAVDHRSEKEAGREKGWEKVCGAHLAHVYQAQKRGQAPCWVQGDGTHHGTAKQAVQWRDRPRCVCTRLHSAPQPYPAPPHPPESSSSLWVLN